MDMLKFLSGKNCRAYDAYRKVLNDIESTIRHERCALYFDLGVKSSTCGCYRWNTLNCKCNENKEKDSDWHKVWMNHRLSNIEEKYKEDMKTIKRCLLEIQKCSYHLNKVPTKDIDTIGICDDE